MEKIDHTYSVCDFVMGRLSPEESLAVLEELERDPEASKELDDVAEILNFVMIQGEEIFDARKYRTSRVPFALRKILLSVEAFFEEQRFAIPVIAVFLVSILVGSFMIVSRLTTSEYFSLTSIENLGFESSVRGPGVHDFDLAYEAFSKDQFEEAIRLLERYIRAYPKSDFVDYAHFAVGATYLVSAKQSFLTLFPSFERERVSRGLEHLQTTIRTSSNPRIIEDSHWLRAKGYLMLNEPEKAIDELSAVESLGGSKKEQASRLIGEIRKLEKGR